MIAARFTYEHDYPLFLEEGTAITVLEQAPKTPDGSSISEPMWIVQAEEGPHQGEIFHLLSSEIEIAEETDVKALITGVSRKNNTKSGNPVWALEVAEKLIVKTEPDAAVGHEITESIVGKRVRMEINSEWRVISLEVLDVPMTSEQRGE